MAQPPAPGSDAGAEPGRDPGLPRGGSGTPGGGPGGPGSPGGGAGVPGAGRAARGLQLGDFAQGLAGDVCLPGLRLAGVLERVSGPDRRCGRATDNELAGILGRWAALESWAAAAKLGVVRELIRRRAEPGHQDRAPGGLPDAWQQGLGHELAAALAQSVPGADKVAALAWALAARLPRTGALLAAGVIDYVKAAIIADELSVLSDEDAARAEALIADQLAGKTPGQAGKLAAAAVVDVDPAGAQKRREQAERENARVRFWRESAGTGALAGYGLPTDAALAATANISLRAKVYKKAKLDGSMDQLRVLAYLDILNGISADTRIAQARTGAEAQARAAPAAGPAMTMTTPATAPPSADPPTSRPADDGPRDDGYLGDGPRDDGFPGDGPRDDGYLGDGPRDDGYLGDGPWDGFPGDEPRDDGDLDDEGPGDGDGPGDSGGSGGRGPGCGRPMPRGGPHGAGCRHVCRRWRPART